MTRETVDEDQSLAAAPEVAFAISFRRRACNSTGIHDENDKASLTSLMELFGREGTYGTCMRISWATYKMACYGQCKTTALRVRPIAT